MWRLLNWYFLAIIPLILYLFFRNKKSERIKFSSIKMIKASGLNQTRKHKVGKYIIVLGLILLIIALARPQSAEKIRNIKQKGIDIVLTLDVSGSMKSVDFKPNRLQVAKNTIKDFIKDRPQDRLSLVIFSGTAYTKIPLTLDHNIIRRSLAEISPKDVNKDGTAIGMGISVAINRLQKSNAKSKIIILATDGANNTGSVNPETAAGLAMEMGIKVYTIGVGTDETIMPVQVFGQTKYRKRKGGLDEALLKTIAQKTDGKYFRAKDPEALDQIFEQIDKLEQTEFDKNNYFQYNELAFILIKIGLILLMIGIFLDRYYYVKIP